jgi:hypothetical protein
MGYYSIATGGIIVTPAIPYDEGCDTDFATAGYHGDSTLEFVDFNDYDEITTIAPRWEDEFKAYRIVDELQTIVNSWPDHKYEGYIEIQGEGDGVGDIDLWRLRVKDGKVEEVKPTLVWPED